MSGIAENLGIIRRRIDEAARRAGRDPAGIRLIAVSKTHSAEQVREAIAAGQCVFGENRVQEAGAKFADLRAEYPALELHLIGSLQTNKAEDAVRHFDVIQTLDRKSLADALSKAIRKTGRTPRLYIEINIGEEPQKAGLTPADLPSFLDYCRERGLKAEGLMCIPPLGQNPEGFFRHMKEMADRFGLTHLSMGMSGDFETAIVCDATEIRVGTAIFGERVK